MRKSIYNTIVHVACLLYRPPYKFITRSTTVSKKSVSTHQPTCPLQPCAMKAPSHSRPPRPPRSSGPPDPARAEMLCLQCCFEGLQVLQTPLLTEHTYYKSAGHAQFSHTKPGSCSFCSRSPRGTTHKGQEPLLLPYCKGQRDTVTCSKPHASARAAAGRARGPQPQTLQQKTHGEGKGMELQVQPDKRLQMHSQLHTGKGGTCPFTAVTRCHPPSTQVFSKSAV